MEINIRRLSEVQIVQIRGALRLGPGVDSFRQTIDDAMAVGDTRMVITAEVPMIDSSGIGILVSNGFRKARGGGSSRRPNLLSKLSS
jgi:anti-anti-sigma regulatory factor